ncbi:MAG: family 78 glycoside hydrolase catalytic domain [Planctomycetota bacterium]
MTSLVSREERRLATLSLFFTFAFLAGSAVGNPLALRASSPEAIRPETLEMLGYEPLFDGKTTGGWSNPFEHGEAEAVAGEIRLRGDKKFFLVTERQYRDFRFIADIRLPEGPANSGLMFRCHVEPGRVYGYQAECDGSARRWSGGLYDEGRRGWIWPSKLGRSTDEFLVHQDASQAHFEQPTIRDALRRNEWNRYSVECVGDRIRIRVNGVLVTDMRDSVDRSGHLGIQHHGEKGQVYRFRNLYVKELPEYPARGNVELVDESPVSVKRLSPGVVLADFGRVAFGNLRLTPPKGAAGELTVRFGERLSDGHVDRRPPGTVRYSERVVTLPPGESLVVEPPTDRRNTGASGRAPVPPVLTPPEWGVVTPFRWVEIEGLPDGLNGGELVRQSAMPSDWDDNAAEFVCSDETLNRVWQLCRYSIKATTFAGVYVDGDRERIPYEADAYLNQLSHYYVEGDTGFGRRTIDWLVENPTWPTEWGPHVIFMAHADWMQTGDAEWLAARYPSLKAKAMTERLGPSGFVESTKTHQRKGDIVDWPPQERDGYVFSEVNTVVNAFHLAAVEQLAAIARAVGADEDATAYEEHARSFRDKFHAAFFDPEAGRYRDGLGIDHHSQHASFFPLAFGITPQEHREEVAAAVADDGMRCSVYGAQYLLQSLLENQQGSSALALMTAPGDRSWRHMLDADATITWEAWDVAYKPNLDWNHAWGAAPANLLPRYVLGVSAAEPAWKRISVSPVCGELSHAEGVVPTPGGPMKIRWEKGKGFLMSLKPPPGTPVKVRLPDDGNSAVAKVDGREVVVKRVDGWLELTDELVGEHTITLD